MNSQKHIETTTQPKTTKSKTARRVRGGRKAASAFRTISEVANELAVQQHVLRFWETKFSQIKPMKRGGGRRYYRPEDVELLQCIHNLLYEEGYTIKGAQKLLQSMRSKSAIKDIAEKTVTASLAKVADAIIEESNEIKVTNVANAEVITSNLPKVDAAHLAQIEKQKREQAKYKRGLILLLKDLKDIRSLINA